MKLANEKMSERDKNGSATVSTKPIDSCNLLQRPEVTAQRISLPDIPLTPRERDILEQSQVKQMRTSHSIESILRDSSPPPPKPPLPGRYDSDACRINSWNFFIIFSNLIVFS